MIAYTLLALDVLTLLKLLFPLQLLMLEVEVL